MTRQPISLILEDVAGFARALRAQLPDDGSGHQTWLNRVARAAGYRNFQHLSALRKEAEPPPNIARVERAFRRFDAQGRFAEWPARQGLRDLCLWAVWSRLPRGLKWTEREISSLIDSFTALKDAAQIRRSLVEMGLLKRNRDGSCYMRVERRPPMDARALISALGQKSSK